MFKSYLKIIMELFPGRYVISWSNPLRRTPVEYSPIPRPWRTREGQVDHWPSNRGRRERPVTRTRNPRGRSAGPVGRLWSKRRHARLWSRWTSQDGQRSSSRWRRDRHVSDGLTMGPRPFSGISCDSSHPPHPLTTPLPRSTENVTRK